jgi:hypothetical protein
VHAVALLEDQLSIDFVPLLTVLGLALSSVTGAGAVTDMVAVCDALPPGPLQVRV